MKKRHRERLRRVEAINLRADIEATRSRYESGRMLRESVPHDSARPLLEAVHAAELAACPDEETRRELSGLHRMEMDGFEGRSATIGFREPQP